MTFQLLNPIPEIFANVPMVFREADPEDSNLILSTWIRTTARHFHHMSVQEHHDHQAGIIAKILPDATLIMAALAEAPLVVFSYIVYTPRTLHFIYTKRDMRNIGLAHRLVTMAEAQAGVPFDSYTTYSRDGDAYLTKHNLKWRQLGVF